MNDYMGQFLVDISTTRYANFTPADWALEYIVRYGGIDGSHHKTWVMDQCVRILKGTPVVLMEARWGNGAKELRFWTDKPSQGYSDFVKELCNGEDGPDTYSYDEGIAP